MPCISWNTLRGSSASPFPWIVIFSPSELTICTAPWLRLCPYSVTKQDIEEHFSTHGTGKITEIKLMNGFGFIEYEDAMDARDIVPGKRLVLQLESHC